MANRNTLIKILFILFIINFRIYVFADDKFDSVNGIWTYRNRIDPCLAIEKLNDNEFFVSYSCKYEHHEADFAGIAVKISENKLLYRAEPIDDEDELYYIYYDEENDTIYVLWNHDFPDDMFYDKKLERVSNIFGPNALTEEEIKQAQQEHTKEIIWNYLLNEYQKKEQSSE